MMPVYILDMLELPAEIKSTFEKGEFSIRQTCGSFNGIWSDMGTEKNIIKDSLTADSKESCTSLVACMPVEIFMRQGGWASISKGHINPEIVFRRALVLANSRDDVTIDNILSHPVGPIPMSMFHEDGTM
jgi:hypothetical protein